MFPVRWMLPVGGVLFAITLLALALITPDGPRSQATNVVSVRSGIIELGERPEWRQYIIQSAIQRRADELSKLRELPDTPIHTDAAPTDSKIAGLPQTVPLDTANSLAIEFPVSAAPEANPQAALADSKIAGLPETVPLDIANSLSIEFPVNAAPKVNPQAALADSKIETVPLDIANSLSIEFPVSAAPEVKPKSRNQARVKNVRHSRRPVTAVNRDPPQTQNVVAFPFGSQTWYTPPLNTNGYFGNQSGQPSNAKGQQSPRQSDLANARGER